ncbi:MAG: carboxypeptidase-like regulatory domain-containing protein [Methanomassiliicoccaceae archaeon]|nr:carboxypeptidase-like regulatory domain-containing protein [Methanomassiliicoccaceae archaeon]
MNRLLLSAVAVIFLSAMFVPVMFSGGAAATGSVTVTVNGQIFAPGADDHSDATIYVDGAVIDHAVVNADGTFSFNITGEPGEERVIGFAMAGYAAWVYIYDNEPIDGGLVVLPASDGAATLFVVMEERTEIISGTVKWRNGEPVGGGVTVEASDPDGGITYTTRTLSDGTYELHCPVNVMYVISVKHAIYEADDFVMTEKLMGPVSNIDFTLLPKKGATYLFELDLTHSLMVIGGLMGLFLLIFVILYRIHIGKHPEKSKVHSDKKKDQE